MKFFWYISSGSSETQFGGSHSLNWLLHYIASSCCARSREDDFYWRFESGLKRQDCRREHVHLILPSGKIAKAVEITVKLKLSNSDTVIIDAMTNSEFLRTAADGLSESRK
jgi:hypothetical protein